MNIEKFEEFISQYPIFEYRLLDTEGIGIEDRNVRDMILPGPVLRQLERWKNVRKKSKVFRRQFFSPVWQKCLTS